MSKKCIQGELRAGLIIVVCLSLLSCSRSKCPFSKGLEPSRRNENPKRNIWRSDGTKVKARPSRRSSVDSDIKLIEKYDRTLYSRLSCGTEDTVRKMAGRVLCRCEAGSGVSCYRVAWMYYSDYLVFRNYKFNVLHSLFTKYMRKSCSIGYKAACFHLQYLLNKMKLTPLYINEQLYKATELKCRRNDLYACVSLAKAHLNAAFIEVVQSVREKLILRAVQYLDMRCSSNVYGSIRICLHQYVRAERMTKARYVVRRAASYFHFACIRGKWPIGCRERAGVAITFPKYFSQKEQIYSYFDGCIRVRGDAERCLWLEAKCASLFSKNLLTKDQKRLCATWKTLFEKAKKSKKPRCFVYVKGLLTCGKKPAR